MHSLARGRAASGSRISIKSSRFLLVAFSLCTVSAFSLTAVAQQGRVFGWGLTVVASLATAPTRSHHSRSGEWSYKRSSLLLEVINTPSL